MFFSRKKGYKRGQFTLFIIVGLVIMFVFGFAFYVRIQIIQASVSQQADTQLREYLNKNSINQYVTSCLDAVVDETFLVTAMRGGQVFVDDKSSSFIRSEQAYPSIQYYNSKLDKTFDIPIVIDTNYNCPDERDISSYTVTQEAGFYPYNCRYTYLSELSKLYKKFGNSPCKNNCTVDNYWSKTGFFGVNSMKVLCDGYGSNAPGIVSDQNFRTCDYYSYDGHSLQEALQDKITYEVKKCINFSEIVKRSSSNITVDENLAKTTVTFGRGEFDVKLEYPFTVTVRNKEPVTKMVDFSVNRQIPFKELYEYGYELSNSDVMDIYFDTNDNKTNVKSRSARRINTNIYSSDFSLNIIRGSQYNEYTDLIQIIDNNNFILGIPLTINFAVKNRRPALDYIHQGNSEWFDLATAEENTITITPKGIDPDGEKKLTYTYSGWREEYTDSYKYEEPNCASPSVENGMEYIFKNCMRRELIDDVEKRPYNWTKSKPYIETSQNASYTPHREDVGFHTITVSVYDRGGLYDTQLVRILVMDLPLADIKGSNMFDDVEDKYASFEDTYTLDGSGSSAGSIAQILGVHMGKMEWYDPIETFNYVSVLTDVEQKKVLELPFDLINTPERTTTILDITTWPFKKVIIPSEGKIHTIDFTVTTTMGLSSTDKIDIIVKQCLPHINNAVYPYPYSIYSGIANDDLAGQLNANHTCCTPDFTYRTVDDPCYNKTVYGIEKYFKDYKTDTTIALPPTIYNIISSGITGKNSENDIFKQEFIRYCSNDRGNICSGRGEEVRDLSLECPDDNGIFDSNGNPKPEFNNERCTGPPENIVTGELSDTEIKECTIYSNGRTFENIVYSATNPKDKDGYCTTTPQFASGTGSGKFYDYNIADDEIISSTKYNYQCEGQCTIDGTCNYATNCKCKVDTRPRAQKVPQGSNDALCDGISYEAQTSSRILTKCDKFGQTYFADYCNTQCGLSDYSYVCKSKENNPAGSGCTADEYCNNVAPGGYAKTSTKPYYCRDGITRTKCDSTTGTNPCGYSNTASNICVSSSFGFNCDADSRCNGVTKNNIANDDPGSYCDNQCKVQTCNRGYKYKSSGQCYTSCTSDSQCTTDYTCCTESSQICGSKYHKCLQS